MGESSFTALPDDCDEEENVNEGADLSESSFEDASLSYIDFGHSDLRATSFHYCNLVGTNFRQAVGVWAGAFRGADLAGAQLPNDISFEPVLKKIEASVILARPAYVLNLLACTSLILALTASSPGAAIKLPLFDIPLSQHAFAIFGSIQSLIISLYVSVYVIRVWEGLAELPSILPNGLASPEVISPWTVLSPAWLHIRVIREYKRLRLPKCYYLQFCLSVVSHWLLTPLTAFVLALSIRDTDKTAALVVISLGIVSLAANLILYITGLRVLRGVK